MKKQKFSFNWGFHLFTGLCLLYLLELMRFVMGVEPDPEWIRIALTPMYVFMAFMFDYLSYKRKCKN